MVAIISWLDAHIVGESAQLGGDWGDWGGMKFVDGGMLSDVSLVYCSLSFVRRRRAEDPMKSNFPVRGWQIGLVDQGEYPFTFEKIR